MSRLEKLLSEKLTELHPILPNRFKTFVWMDLTTNNKIINPPTLENFEGYQQSLLENSKADFTAGRYNEKRAIYQTDLFFDEQPRDIHLGIDINVPVSTPIFAPLPGRVHSYANNQAPGDYGPTIIIEHQLKQTKFYCLYGHLSLEDLESIAPNKRVEKGELIGHTGAPEVNGNWPSHCHIQLIEDIGNYRGDYPGVCSEAEASKWLANSPDPRSFLTHLRKVN